MRTSDSGTAASQVPVQPTIQLATRVRGIGRPSGNEWRREGGGAYRLGRGLVILEGDIAETARAAAVVGDEGVGDLTVHLKCSAQQLRTQRVIIFSLTPREGSREERRPRTLPLTDHGRLLQKSWVFENGRSWSAAAGLPSVMSLAAPVPTATAKGQERRKRSFEGEVATGIV